MCMLLSTSDNGAARLHWRVIRGVARIIVKQYNDLNTRMNVHCYSQNMKTLVSTSTAVFFTQLSRCLSSGTLIKLHVQDA